MSETRYLPGGSPCFYFAEYRVLMTEVGIEPGGCGGGGLGLKEDASAIVITDDDTPGSDSDTLCQFPPGQSPCIKVTLRDYRTLELGVYLNDIVIDFYLAWLHVKVLPSDQNSAVYIFPTLFFKRLTEQPENVSTNNSYEKDPSLSQAQIRHTRVKGWSKKVDVFSKDMIIIPICENSHWYLVIVIKPGLILQDEADKRPFVLVFDSLGGERGRTVNIVREYFDQEWKSKVRL